jgi:replication factor C subunit 3/5
MTAVLNSVADRESFQLPEEAAKQVIEDSNGNLRKALLVMEALKMQS